MVTVPGFDIPMALILIGCGIISILCVISITGYKLWKKLKEANNNLINFTETANKIMIDVPILPPNDYKDMKKRMEAYGEYMKGNRKPMEDYWKGFYDKEKMG